MHFAYTTAGWENFFFAEVGASSALVGLLFVAVSINLAKILQIPTLPGRAFEALLLLVMVLLVSTFALVPGQSIAALGVETLSTSAVVWLVTAAIQLRAPKLHVRRWILTRVISVQLATLPMLIAGASLMLGRGGGLYWSVGSVVGAFLAALIDSWVLLVEIHR